MLYLDLGWCFNQKIGPNILPENLISLTFGHDFNQKIGPNILPNSLASLIYKENIQLLKQEYLPSNLKNIIIDWICCQSLNQTQMNMINDIPDYYNVIFLLKYIIPNCERLKWSRHVVYYDAENWPSITYDIINKYTHPIHGDITVRKNKKKKNVC